VTKKHTRKNDVLPLKTALRYAIVNLKCFWARDTSDLVSMVLFTFALQRLLIRLTIYLLPWVPVADFRVQHLAKEAERRIYGGCAKTPVLFKPVCGPKFVKFCDKVRYSSSQRFCPIVYITFHLKDIRH